MSRASLSLQELSGQQQTSSESEFDFPQEEAEFTASEFREDGMDAEADCSRSSADEAPGVGGTQSVFQGYKDPSKQFGGHTRSYHQDARSDEHSMMGL